MLESYTHYTYTFWQQIELHIANNNI